MKWEIIYQVAFDQFGKNIVECTRVSYTDTQMQFHVGDDIVAVMALDHLVFAHKLAQGGIVRPKPWRVPSSEEEVFINPPYDRPRVRYRDRLESQYDEGPSDRIQEAAQDLARRLRPGGPVQPPSERTRAELATWVAPRDSTQGELGENCA